ncbi:alpha-ketoacid dehydrogenase subunit beta [Rhodococcus oxybenzonivorans]|nr:transketolase C-terminal domain-containing protein [Rhodococcus oxybenzonivorans]
MTVTQITKDASTTVQFQEMNFQQACLDAFDYALSTDPSVFMLGEDIADPAGGVFKMTKGLSTKFGTERVRATPIAEQALIGTAIGAGLAGMRPIVEIMLMDFFGVAMDQIANHAAKLRYMSGGRTAVPITIRTVVGAGRGNMGAQHSQSLEAWLANVPGLKVVCASNPLDAKGLLLSSIYDEDPCVVMEMSRVVFDPQKRDVPVGDYRVPLGRASIARPGADLSIITYGRAVLDALEAAEALAAEGVDVEVVDLRSLVPLDISTVLQSVAKTKRAIVAHAAVQFGGFGAEVSSQIHEELLGELHKPVRRLGAPYAPTPGGPLEAQYVPDAARMIQAARDLLA